MSPVAADSLLSTNHETLVCSGVDRCIPLSTSVDRRKWWGLAQTRRQPATSRRIGLVSSRDYHGGLSPGCRVDKLFRRKRLVLTIFGDVKPTSADLCWRRGHRVPPS